MLAEQIKQDPEMGSAVVMMLTSGDRPEDASRCEQLGISGYLLKPIKQSELLEAIETHSGIGRGQPVPADDGRSGHQVLRQPAHAAGRGQPVQSETGRRLAGGPAAYGHRRQQRQEAVNAVAVAGV